jgi:hypothetical protein
LEDQSVGGKMGVRMDLRETGLGGVDWIRLAQGRDRWWAVVSVWIGYDWLKAETGGGLL